MNPTSNPNRHPTQAIRAEIVGNDQCSALGIVARSPSPVLDLCRLLVELGYDPSMPLVAYRGDTLALIVRSIGEAAKLDVNSKGTGFIRHRPAVRIAAPIAQTVPGRVRVAGGSIAALGGGSP